MASVLPTFVVRRSGVAAFGVPSDLGDRHFLAVEARLSQIAVIRRKVASAVVAEVGLGPSVVLVIPYGQLPKTSSGKLRRAETRRQYLLGQPGLPTPERSVR